MRPGTNALDRPGPILQYIALSASALAIALSVIPLTKKGDTAYVDTVKLFTGYKGSQKAKAEYEKKAAVWKANIDTLTSEFNSAVAKHNGEKAKMTAKEKKLSEELLAAKQRQLEDYRAAISENAAKEDREMTSKVNSEITDFLKDYGDEKGYDYILGATGTGNILYAKKGTDITGEALKELNARYGGQGK